MVRTTNQIVAAFRKCLLGGLEEWFGVGEDKCAVLYVGQAIPQNAKRCITFAKIGEKRVGFQGKRLVDDGNPEGDFDETEEWIGEMTFQVNARSKETIGDALTTVTARDIADGLVSWFNSWRGLELCAENGIYPLRSGEIRNMTVRDESDLMANNSRFDITVHIGQSKKRKADAAFVKAFQSHRVEKDGIK